MTTNINPDIDHITLKAGDHKSRNAGTCLLEAVAWFAGEPHSDHPACVSPFLAAFGRAWNDGMRTDAERESLKQYIPMLVGTAGDAEADERRAWLATDWLVRVQAPEWLRLAGLTEHADKLAALQPVTTAAYAASVQREIADAAGAAWAAWAAAQAAGDAGDARAAAWAAWAARAAAGAAAGDARAALEPTVLALQESAHDLYARMIRAEECPQTWPALTLEAGA